MDLSVVDAVGLIVPGGSLAMKIARKALKKK